MANPLESDDAIEVAKVLGNTMRPIWLSIVGGLALFSGGGTELWSLHSFMHAEALHETKQDENMLVLKNRLDERDIAAKRAAELSTKIISLQMQQLDLLRAQVVKLSPKREREKLRDNFAAQRTKSVELLVLAQKP
jgi:hypothetical protein